MKVSSKVNTGRLRQIEKAATESLVLTAEEIKADVKREQTMPFDIGTMQNEQTFVDDSDAKSGKVSVVTDAPQARRLYFHPEFNFQKTKNPNAGGMWFEPYINGVKKDYAKKVFARYLRNRI